MSDRIAYRLADGVVTITMDDGKVNVMSIAMLKDLGAAFRQAEKDQAIVVLRSGRRISFPRASTSRFLPPMMLSAVWKW